eukprot:TRINITY_DN16752_c0_g1_i10.p1 TRINITY_DN16752_c0_g1~~TRINITY_DN16752_c0_g1_i10.p1  ORF type:complete len:818 (+),score=159.23 TRINITY_DN16752_c0_g1_i10:281-2734(+)
MEFGEDNSFAAASSTFYGAIFMSNRATRRECVKKKLFGLPRSQISFVKKIKSGMTLFLFEYEERKLYGVYEATCDGALDIDPCAFTSSGKSFAAQIRVKLISLPRPLPENEFSDAIKDNYYTANKFSFYLSREQVDKLIELFQAQRTNIHHSSSWGRRKKAMKQPKEFVVNNNIRVTFKNDTIENDIDMDKDTGPASSVSYHDLHRPNLNPSGSYKTSILDTYGYAMGNGEPSLSLAIPHSSELRLSDPMPPTSRSVGTVNLSGSSHHDHPCYRRALGFQPKPSYPSLGGTDIRRSIQDITVYPKCLADSVYPSSRKHLFESHTDSDALDSSDFLSLNVAHNPEEYEHSTVPEDHVPPSLYSTSNSRYFQKKFIHATTMQSTYLKGYEFNDRFEPYIPIPRTRSIGVKRIRDPLFPCNPGNDPSHLCNYCYPASSSLGGDHEKTQTWPTAAVPLAEAGKLRRNRGSFPFSSTPEYSYEDGNGRLTMHDEESLSTVMFSNFKSDTYDKKASVFSRLSHHVVESAQDNYEPRADSSVSRFMNQVQTEKEWKHVMRKPGNMWNAGGNTESMTDMEMSAVDDVNNDEELGDNNETADDHGIPFLNFKRRSQARNTASEMKTETCVEAASSGKSKRRKLIRPSFKEEPSCVEGPAKYLNAEGSSPEPCGSHLLDLNKGKGEVELSEAPNREDGKEPGENVFSQELSVCPKPATNVKANEGLLLESVIHIPVGENFSQGNTNGFSTDIGDVSPPSLIGKGETFLQGEGDTNGISEVVIGVQTCPLSQFDSQNDNSFKECSEANVVLSINEESERKKYEETKKK